jgi:hypothetical protein
MSGLALEEERKGPARCSDEALVIPGDLPALWTSLDDNWQAGLCSVLFQKLVINDG